MFRSVMTFGPLLLFAATTSICQAQAQAPANGTAMKAQTHKAAAKPAAKDKKPAADVVKLTDVLQAVEAIVDSYNSRPETQGEKPKLPPLQTADFDFKAVAELKGGPSINLWLFKAGATWDKQQTTDVDYQYKPQALFGLDQATLTDELSKAIDAAANQLTGANADGQSKTKLQLKQFSVSFAYQIGKDYQGGVNIPIHIVTLGGTVDKNNVSTQTVKLVFAFPDKKP
jgi:Trypsin-co-occurring domain 2